MKRSLAFILFCLISSLAGWSQAPTANFTADITRGCYPIVVKFQDLSTGNPTSWEWDLGNGTVSTLQNPAGTYVQPGAYVVKLKVKNANGTDSLIRDSFIVAYDKPNTDFNVSTQNTCTPAPVQFSDATIPQSGNTIVAWKWDFGDGGTGSTDQNPTHVYTVPGSYTITLTTTNDKGCTNLKTEPNYINVIKGVVPNFSNTQQTVCKPPVSISFNNTSTGPATLSYFWDFGDGQTSTDKNPTNIYNSVGSFQVTLAVVSSYGCTDTLRRPGAVTTSQIITDFGVPVVCPNTEVQFFDSSSDFSLSSLWKFSDGTTDTSASPYKVYTTPGTYTVTLVNNYAACTDSVTKTVNVMANPTVDFTAVPVNGCQTPFSVTFNNSAAGATTYQWDFGDSTGATEPNPTHQYNNYGNYNVTLTATNGTGCTATATKPAFIKIQKPTISFNKLPDQGCVPYTISPTSTVTSVDSVVSYRWDFGDGNTSTDQAPTHTYNAVGKYDVSLTVTTASGCTESYTLPNAVKVGTKPTADFTMDRDITCARDAIQFTDHSSDSADEWHWNFGDGSSSGEKNPKHEFNNIGTLTVTLIALNNGCKSDSVSKTVTIKAPIAVFTYQPADCKDVLKYAFKNQSITGALPNPLTWKWDFGDGTSSTEKDPPVHTFPAFGTYTVSLYVSNGECDYTMTLPITVKKHYPDFAADARVGCKPMTVVFTPNDLGDTLIKQYAWDFGDGKTAITTGAANHVYDSTGDYDVSLITTSVYGCSDTSILKPKYIRVNGPIAKFSSTTNLGCIGLTTTFNDESKTDGVNPIVSWKWNFGDRTTQTYTAPPFQHTYQKVARYDVSLVVTDSAGCRDSITYDNFVRTSNFKMEWSGTRQTCPGAPVQFNSISNTRNYTTFWDFGNGDTAHAATGSQPNASSITYSYKDTGTYNIKLVITDTLGCKDSLVKPYYTQVYRPMASFGANNFATYCVPFTLQLSNNSSYYTSSFWDLAIGTSTQTNPVSYYTKTGTYNLKLTVTSPGGCTSDTTKVLHVYNASEGKLTYGPLDFSCRPLVVNFSAFSDLNAEFVWDFGDGNVVDTTSHLITHTYTNVGNFIPKIILREPDGCLVPVTGSAPVHVAGANIAFGIDKRFFCDSGQIAIFDSTQVAGPGVTYNWDFGDGTGSTDAKPATHYYYKTGTFPVKLTVKTSNGCTDSLALRPGVRVSMTPVIHINGDTVICMNQYLRSGGVFDKHDSSFIRWAWQFPNGTTSALQQPPDQQFTTAGRFAINAIATNSEGCADSALKNILVNPLPTSDLPSVVTTQPGYPVSITGDYSPNVKSWLWRPTTGLSCTDCANPVASPKFSTKYIVQYTDSNGCVNTNLVQVIVICKNANVFVPNTFSPNGDGHNDIFYIRGKGLDRVKSLRIFDRWGEVVFEKQDFPVNDASQGWDGRYKGADPKPDVYVYQLEVFCENSEIIRIDGNVALIK